MKLRQMLMLMLMPFMAFGTLAYSSLKTVAQPFAALPRAVSQNEVCYALADNNDESAVDSLVRIDFETGVTQYVGTNSGLTGTFSGESLTFNLDTGTLYSADGGHLVTFNLTTGVATSVSPAFGTARGTIEGGISTTITITDVDGLSFDPADGTLFGIVRREPPQAPFDDPPLADALIKINPATGLVIPDGFGTGVDFMLVEILNSFVDIDDIAFDVVTGTLYGISNNGGTGDVLVIIDKATGVITPFANTLGVADMEGLTFDPNGQLLGSTGKSSGANSNRVFRIDKVTGIADVATSKSLEIAPGTPFDYEGLDCLSSPVIDTPTPTPTNTSTDTSTPTPTNTATNTSTPTPTNTATNTPTDTPTSTPITFTPTASNTPTITPTPTATSPTAVKLLYFRAVPGAGLQVTLDWATAAEVDNYGFRLYRSADSSFVHAQMLHFEPAAGGFGGNQYSYIDSVPSSGQWWYWLEDVDTRGKTALHEPVSVNVSSGQSAALKLYVPVLIQKASP